MLLNHGEVKRLFDCEGCFFGVSSGDGCLRISLPVVVRDGDCFRR